MYLIIFDLDDTLLKSDHSVSLFTLETLKRIQKDGHLLAFNTSRSRQASRRLFDLIKPDYGIYCGGAEIIDKNGKIIYQTAISAHVTQEITKLLFENADNVSVQTPDYFFTSDANYHNQNAIYVDFQNGLFMESYKIITKCLNIDFLLDIAKKYDLAFQNYLNGPFSRFGTNLARKHLGNVALKKIVGENYKTVVFGDDSGDLEMITQADIGVAMSNSVDIVIQNAPHITLSNDEDGIAHYLVNVLHL